MIIAHVFNACEYSVLQLYGSVFNQDFIEGSQLHIQNDQALTATFSPLSALHHASPPESTKVALSPAPVAVSTVS